MSIPSIILNWQELADLIIDDIHITTPDYTDVVHQLNDTIKLLEKYNKPNNRTSLIEAHQLHLSSSSLSETALFSKDVDTYITGIAFSCDKYYSEDTIRAALYKKDEQGFLELIDNISVKNMLQRKVFDVPLVVPANDSVFITYYNRSKKDKTFYVDIEYSVQNEVL